MLINPNIWGQLRDFADNDVWNLVGSGVPTDGTAGTGAALAGIGSRYTDIATGRTWYNYNTKASPAWVETVNRTAIGTISSADMTGTGVGQLGHANGYPMVAPVGTHNVPELISAVMIYDFITAAYGAGGNVTVNLSGGGAAQTGLVSNANSLAAAADKLLLFVPLTTAAIVLVENAGLNLVSSVALTQPGTAAGVIRYRVQYRVHPTGF